MRLTVTATEYCSQTWIGPDLTQDWDAPAADTPFDLTFGCLWPWCFRAAGRNCFPSMLGMRPVWYIWLVFLGSLYLMRTFPGRIPGM